MTKRVSNGSWFRGDPIWGGETLTCKVVKPKVSRALGIRAKDQFRVEKGPNSRLTLIPNPRNKGTWKDSHSKSNPVRIDPEEKPTTYKRAYLMKVKIKKEDKQLTELFLIELQNGTVAIAEKAVHPPHGRRSDHDYASVER